MEQVEFKERGRVVQQPRRFLVSYPIAEGVIQAAVVPVSCCCAGNPQLRRDLPSEVDLCGWFKVYLMYTHVFVPKRTVCQHSSGVDHSGRASVIGFELD